MQPAHETCKPKDGRRTLCRNLKQKRRLLGSFHIPAAASYCVYSKRKSREMLNTLMLAFI